MGIPRIDLATECPPVAFVRFPTGHECAVMEVSAYTERLRREAQADPTNEDKVRALMRALVPDATDDDWERATARMVTRIWQLAEAPITAALAEVEQRRKNADAGSGGVRKPRRSRRSSRTTTSATPVPASPGSTGVGTAPPV